MFRVRWHVKNEAHKKGETPGATDVSKKARTPCRSLAFSLKSLQDAGGKEAEKAKDKTKELQAKLQELVWMRCELRSGSARGDYNYNVPMLFEDVKRRKAEASKVRISPAAVTSYMALELAFFACVCVPLCSSLRLCDEYFGTAVRGSTW